jgi:hypothetical protein
VQGRGAVSPDAHAQVFERKSGGIFMHFQVSFKAYIQVQMVRPRLQLLVLGAIERVLLTNRIAHA